jgi:type VI secretion system protein ImpH
MASARRRTSAAVTEQLQREPQRFDFFQAVRLLERAAQILAQDQRPFAQVPVAMGAPPNRESIRFRANASLAFRGTDIDQVEIADTISQDAEEAPKQQWQVRVNIFGLFGSNGILPFHMSELVIKRLRQKDRALAEFLDVLNHRSTSLYFQSWHKYRLPVAFERSRTDGKQQRDLFSQVLASLAGLGTSQLEDRLPLPDEALLGYGAHLGRGAPSAPTLARILQQYFELPITVEQFIPQWQTLPEDMRSRLPGRDQPQGQNNFLGMNVILGRQCWDVQSKFRIRIAELEYDQFVAINPNSQKMQALKAFARFMVGNEFDFDIEICIDQNKIPRIGLGQELKVDGKTVAGSQLMLGWNCSLDKSARESSATPQLVRILVNSKTATSSQGTAP